MGVDNLKKVFDSVLLFFETFAAKVDFYYFCRYEKYNLHCFIYNADHRFV